MTKINAAGSALVYSTYLGGSNNEEGGFIAVDASGSAYVTGNTHSNDFQPLLNYFQGTCGGDRDAFVTKLDDVGNAVYSSYLGGSGPEAGSGIAVDSFGNAYVAGNTRSDGGVDCAASAFQTRSVSTASSFQGETVEGNFIAASTALLSGDGRFVAVITTTNSDLIISALLTTTIALAPGGSLSLSNTAKNQGGSSAGSFVIAFHLSGDAVYGGTDDIAFTTTRSVTSLGVGASSPASTPLTVPSTTPLGSYYLCALADSTNTVSEGNETNNSLCTASTIQVSRPDLLMTQVQPSAAAVSAGGTLSVTNTVKNQGAVAAGGFTIAFHLSVNMTYGDADDVVITTTRPVISLAAGASSQATASLTIPGATRAGSYYVCTKADSTGAVSETNEMNNTLCSPSQVTVPPPDLIIAALSTTTPALAPGGSLSLSNTAKNQGGSSAGSFVIAFHLSGDAVYGGTDDIAFTTTRSVTSLGVGASSPATTTLTVPATTPLGSYYVCALADSTNTISEGNENNNTRCTISTLTVTGPG